MKVDLTAIGAELLFEANIRTEAPRITVRMITYMHADFIVKAVSSILEGTYDDYELIISDDASPDNTKEVLLEYLRGYKGNGQVRYVRMRKNGGADGFGHSHVFRALTRGLLVMGMDGDDFSCPDRLEKTVALWNSLNPKPSMMVVNAYRYVDGKVEGFAKPDFAPRGERRFYPPGDLFGQAPVFGSGAVVSREFFDWTAQFKSICKVIAGDAVQVKRAFMDKGIWFINEPLFYYRVHAGSATHQSTEKWTRDRLLRWFQLKSDLKEFYKGKNIPLGIVVELYYWIVQAWYSGLLMKSPTFFWCFLFVPYMVIYPTNAVSALKIRVKKVMKKG